MKTKLVLFFALFFLSGKAFSQEGFPVYYQQNDLSPAAPSSYKSGLFGFNNPAALNFQQNSDIYFSWNMADADKGFVKKWGAFAASPGFGFGAIQSRTTAGVVTDYRVSAAGGSDMVSTGMSFGWSTGASELFNHTTNAMAGVIVRPNRYFSIGASGTFAFGQSNKEFVGEGAVRPLGNELLTLFADYGYHPNAPSAAPKWSAGGIVEPVPGIRVTGRYFDQKTMTFGVEWSIGNAGFSAQTNNDKNGKNVCNSYGVRLGAYDRNIFEAWFTKKSRYLEINNSGSVGYRRFEYFDQTLTLKNLLDQLEAVKNDPSVTGIVINTRGLSADRVMLWEVREKLKEIKSAGKKIVMFIENGSLDLYHLASVADKIVLDPVGLLAFDGYVMGRTYLKGTLEKLGIGYDEWRFFKYKSAVEVLTRDKMSDADREQRQLLVNEYMAMAKKDICEGRNFSPEQFDELLDKNMIFFAAQAVEKKLVDTLGRWGDAKEIIKALEGESKEFIGAGKLAAMRLPEDNQWGPKPRIAIVYALGECAMDAGISARTLVHDLKKAIDDPAVRAIVLRVDSPGGDAMASDYIAAEMKRAKGKKPIIVTQGFVAGSGGYWLSMYGDTIIAAPSTITGSIGVIGGWIYNKGLKESLGMSTDFVKAGTHGDLGFGFSLPFVGLGIPDRPLSAEEREILKSMILTTYKEFVGKVAEGRSMTTAEVETVAQGRVWTGRDGQKIGLVDLLGGLEKAIAVAKECAKIPADEKVDIIELPKAGFINFNAFLPSIGIETAAPVSPVLDQIRFRLKHNGQVMPVMPLEDLDAMDRYSSKQLTIFSASSRVPFLDEVVSFYFSL